MIIQQANKIGPSLFLIGQHVISILHLFSYLNFLVCSDASRSLLNKYFFLVGFQLSLLIDPSLKFSSVVQVLLHPGPGGETTYVEPI
jgi:hypothetical protein